MKSIFKPLLFATSVLTAALYAGIASAAGPSDAELNRYNLEYCSMVNHEYKMLQQGYDVPVKRARIIRSEKKKCIEVWTAYRKIHPSGATRTTTVKHPKLF